MVAFKLISEWLVGMLMGLPWSAVSWCTAFGACAPPPDGALAFQPRGLGLGVFYGGDPAGRSMRPLCGETLLLPLATDHCIKQLPFQLKHTNIFTLLVLVGFPQVHLSLKAWSPSCLHQTYQSPYSIYPVEFFLPLT